MGWVELDIQIGQAGFGFKRDILESHDLLVRGSSRIMVADCATIIAFDHLFVHVFFGDQFQDRLEEVEVEA